MPENPAHATEVRDLYTKFDAVFFEKTRLSIITLLYRDKEISFNQLKEALGASDGGLYAHLEKLRQAGYVDRQKAIIENSISSQYFLTLLGKTRFREYVEFLASVVNAHTEKESS